jgi:hypothetical protein
VPVGPILQSVHGIDGFWQRFSETASLWHRWGRENCTCTAPDKAAAKERKARKKNPVAQALVAMRHKKLSPARRKEIAVTAARARWGASKTTGAKPKPGRKK